MGKNVLIIGASGDIGIAIAKELADDGYQLMLHYHQNKQAIEKLHDRIKQEQVLLEIQADLTKQNEIAALLDELVFPVDAIIFTSGTARYGLFQEASTEEMDSMLTLHVKAPWLIIKQLLPPMIKRRSGSIIFITSIWGNVGASHEVMYSSVKGAQNSFVKALAKEVAPSGVSVNAVSPGFIDTKMNGHLTPSEIDAVLERIPMNRVGKPDEVAHVVGFLLDEKSNYIQGEIIEINGGW
ncbi:SDR family oxidoreductase [Virgibacillus dakarensis]|uniref:Oxidoreductase YmfI n=1 Tax=Lentibacillus populi TaxID=1827502 RepID=A0A9W5TVH3_9BACI|nr:SDR family oxidoreductase [Lentibacillus populi]MTW84916.1 SDR family oxidoreductase [Virgibacillus dakarensis]GGB30830.1 putative oxidoreductase YmfI [Lentibacillus populi]